MPNQLQLNPVLRISVEGNETFIWQTTRFALKLEGNPAELVESLWKLRDPFTLHSLPPKLHSLAEFLLARNCLVTNETAVASKQDRRIAAWSILNPDPISIANRLSGAFAVIIGAGGVGSATAHALCKLGIGELAICDSDTVEEVNLSKSFIFSKSDIGKNKTEAIKNHLSECKTIFHEIHEKVENLSSIFQLFSRAPNIIIWGGDENETITFREFANTLRGSGIAITTGGVIEHTACVGPTLLPNDIDKFKYSDLKPPTDIQILTGEFNEQSINPGTITSANIVANIIANEVFAVITGSFHPPLRNKQLLIDLLTFESISREFPPTKEPTR